MTAAAYTTDLTTLQDAQSGTWSKTTATGWTAGPNSFAANDTDAFVQGTAALSSSMKTGAGGVLTPALANFTVPTDGAILLWMKYDTPNSLDSETNGGIRLVIGNGTAQFYAWKLGGNDNYIYGGWQCLAANDTVSADYNPGGPASPWQRVGLGVNAIAVPSKGNPFWIDAIRVGRCEARFAGGTTPDAACTFAGFAAVNDQNTNPYNRWGLLQAIAGGYLWQGLMVIGYGAACRFTDSGINVSIANTKKVTANFNTIEIRNASTVVDWTGVNFTALGTVSPGRWVATDDATVGLNQCSFTGMGTFAFKPATTATGCTFRNCDAITPAGGKLLGCLIDASRVASNTSAVVWNNTNPSGYLDGCTFKKGATANHAIEFPTDCPDAISLPGVTFSGYNASDNQNDSAIHVKRTSGQVTITCAALPSVRSDGATIVKVGSAVNVTVYAKDIDGANVNDARVLLKAANGTGPFPFEETVTITNSGTTATVAHTGHGMATGDKVMIDGASHWQNNGVFSITKTSDDEYTYTLPSAPGSNPTGTIKATFVALSGTTSSGFLTTSREYASAQPVVGWIRKSSAAPYYKPAPLTGTIPSTGEFTATGVMILDQ